MLMSLPTQRARVEPLLPLPAGLGGARPPSDRAHSHRNSPPTCTRHPTRPLPHPAQYDAAVDIVGDSTCAAGDASKTVRACLYRGLQRHIWQGQITRLTHAARCNCPSRRLQDASAAMLAKARHQGGARRLKTPPCPPWAPQVSVTTAAGTTVNADKLKWKISIPTGITCIVVDSGVAVATVASGACARARVRPPAAAHTFVGSHSHRMCMSLVTAHPHASVAPLLSHRCVLRLPGWA